MARMAPEQEAAEALQRGWSRSQVSRGARPEYDRLLQEREYAAAVEAARLAAEEAARLRAAEDAAAQLIPILTVDTLPPTLGGNREVKRVRLAKVWDCESPEHAEEALREWVRENNYDAVVGVRLVSIAKVSGQIHPATGTSYGSTQTSLSWAIYGTAISCEMPKAE